LLNLELGVTQKQDQELNLEAMFDLVMTILVYPHFLLQDHPLVLVCSLPLEEVVEIPNLMFQRLLHQMYCLVQDVITSYLKKVIPQQIIPMVLLEPDLILKWNVVHYAWQEKNVKFLSKGHTVARYIIFEVIFHGYATCTGHSAEN